MSILINKYIQFIRKCQYLHEIKFYKPDYYILCNICAVNQGVRINLALPSRQVTMPVSSQGYGYV